MIKGQNKLRKGIILLHIYNLGDVKYVIFKCGPGNKGTQEEHVYIKITYLNSKSCVNWNEGQRRPQYDWSNNESTEF